MIKFLPYSAGVKFKYIGDFNLLLLKEKIKNIYD